MGSGPSMGASGRAYLSQLRVNLVLAARNRMGLIYGFAFPLIFLGAFWSLYRHDEVPLLLHMGELITVTVLGGACFGLPTSLVSERERGVWRRYRLTPTPTFIFLASLLTARFVLVLGAALMQIAVAMAAGMPAPSDPLGLLLAFVLVAFAFLGVGMVIAMIADNVPTVQALGQCIFLPMLIVGGVAVRLSALPAWAQQVSAFLPGRYAVAALQRSVSGSGQGGGGFELFALFLIGAAGFLAAVQMFRWDPAQRFRLTSAKAGAGLAVALGMWLVVGAMTHMLGRVAVSDPVLEDVGTVADFVAPPGPAAPAPAPVVAAQPAPAANTAAPAPPPPPPAAPTGPASWRDATAADFKRVAFDKLPPDEGVIAPFARADEIPAETSISALKRVEEGLPVWPPGQVEDPIQWVRNNLYVAAVPDLLQMAEVERFLPEVVFLHLKSQMSQDELAKALFWVAMHPDEGDDAAIQRLGYFGLPPVKGQTKPVHGRVMLYALKMLGRLTGDLPVAPVSAPPS
jgi:hypothetical protein